jgi:hypothetical protein
MTEPCHWCAGDHPAVLERFDPARCAEVLRISGLDRWHWSDDRVTAFGTAMQHGHWRPGEGDPTGARPHRQVARRIPSSGCCLGYGRRSGLLGPQVRAMSATPPWPSFVSGWDSRDEGRTAPSLSGVCCRRFSSLPCWRSVRRGTGRPCPEPSRTACLHIFIFPGQATRVTRSSMRVRGLRARRSWPSPRKAAAPQIRHSRRATGAR